MLTHCAVSGVEIASSLGLNYVFLCEFEELHSPLRTAEAQVGTALTVSRLAARKVQVRILTRDSSLLLDPASELSPAMSNNIDKATAAWAHTQGGGVHGNAILSKFDISNVRAVEHR